MQYDRKSICNTHMYMQICCTHMANNHLIFLSLHQSLIFGPHLIFVPHNTKTTFWKLYYHEGVFWKNKILLPCRDFLEKYQDTKLLLLILNQSPSPCLVLLPSGSHC